VITPKTANGHPQAAGGVTEEVCPFSDRCFEIRTSFTEPVGARHPVSLEEQSLRQNRTSSRGCYLPSHTISYGVGADAFP